MSFSTDEIARAALADAVASLESAGHDPTDFVGALERYAHAVSDAALLRDRWTRRGRPMLGTGSAAQLVEHAMFRAMRDAEIHAAKMGDALMLTPASRAGKRVGGHPAGVGQAADRRPGLRKVK